MKNKKTIQRGFLLAILVVFVCLGGVVQIGQAEQGVSGVTTKNLLAAGSFSSYGSAGSTVDCAGGDKIGGVCFPSDTGLSSAPIKTILEGFLYWLFGVFSIVAIMAFVVSGIQYLISAGDEGMIEKAKMNMKWSIVGIIVGLSGFIVLRAVDVALSGSAFF